MLTLKNRPNKLWAFVLAAILLSSAGVAAYFSFFHTKTSAPSNPDQSSQTQPQTESNVNYDPPTETEKNANQQQKDEIIKNQEQNQTPAPTDAFSVTIIRANQFGTGQPLQVRTLVNGTTDGTCKMTLSQDAQPTLTKSFPVKVEANAATCSGADIPASEFANSGAWNLSIVIEKGTQVSQAVTKTITIVK